MSLFVLQTVLLVGSSLPASALTFPALGTGKPVKAELVSADFVHRSGQFRTEKGELIDFHLPPYGIMKYRGVEADLRDVPLGAKMTFLMLPGEDGKSGRLITTQDDQPKDEAQQEKFVQFTKARGLAGWIDSTTAETLTVTFFSGAPETFQKTWGADFSKGKSIRACVANDELRTWNPGVDGERGSILEVKNVPVDGHGCSGLQVTMKVSNMLEGFRRGRIVRVFGPDWKVQDQFYGESLMGYGFSGMLNQELVENVAKEYPEQFPFRTDYGNAHLPWYQLQPGVKPPLFSAHLILGQLVKFDAPSRSGEFLTEGSGIPLKFTLTDGGSILQEVTSKPGDSGPTRFKEGTATARYRAKEIPLAELPTGIRYRFNTYQDQNGSFTQVSDLCDEYTRMTSQHFTARITHVNLDKEQLQVSWQLPLVKDYNGDMQRPPDIGWSFLKVTDQTRVWKGDASSKLTDLKVGDVLRLNQTAELPGQAAYCTDLWIDRD